PAVRRAPRLGLRPVSPAKGTPRPARRHAVGRRAADGGDRPGTDVAPQAPAHGRAVRRPCAARRAAGVRSGAPHPRRGLHRADRRAERRPGARSGRPRLSARGRRHQACGLVSRAQAQRPDPPILYGAMMDIFLVEAVINGILLGGVLALLALGLNLIFGVIDVVWIAYADLVMCGMYAIYWFQVEFGLLLPLACAVVVLGVAARCALALLLVIPTTF